jgi:thiol-disulfide isomerase/thioredoxin
MRTAALHRIAAILLAIPFVLLQAAAQNAASADPGQPGDLKARRTFSSALELQKRRDFTGAMQEFRKANKQDGGHCGECLQRAYALALQLAAWTEAQQTAREMLPFAVSPADQAEAHYRVAIALQREGLDTGRLKSFAESCDEFKAALAANPDFVQAHFALGLSLAHVRRDDEARSQFRALLSDGGTDELLRRRAQRYLANIDLARAPLAPPFSLVALDGQQVSLDTLSGKVVLVDFWATWCAPCLQALPYLRDIARKFRDQPVVVLSISLDSDEARWKAFVVSHNMPWLQYRDGGFDGPVSRQFCVHAIPAAFTIDAEGILEGERAGDSNMEGKMRKLLARAAQMKKAMQIGDPAERPGGSD